MIDLIASNTTNSQPSLLAVVFPNADPQIVSALSSQGKALTRYLAQIHELTLSETTETVEAFFSFQSMERPKSEVA